MKNKLPKYDNYKPSNVDWLGDIPQNWEVKRIKHLFKIGRGRVIAQTELQENGLFPVYSSQTQNNGILGYINTYDFDCQQITWTTDGANAGTVFLREGKHNCTNVCGTLQKSSENILGFVKYILQTATPFYKRPDTNGAKIMNGEMAEIPILLPPLSEQEKIAQFLDEKTTKIDKAIEIKQRQIELLKERRQILIHRAVTRGVESLSGVETPLKGSGVEWIGEIPEHWEVKKIKHLVAKAFSGGTPSTDKLDFWDGGIPWVSSVDVKTDYLFKTTREISEKGLNRSSSSLAPKGSVIFVTRSGILQHTFAISILGKEMAINQDIKCLILNEIISAEYFQKIIKGNNSQILVEVRQQGATVESINMESFFNLTIALPPIEEQKAIVSHIETLSAKISKAIGLKEREMAVLKEYKRSLINSAVTGKVRIF